MRRAPKSQVRAKPGSLRKVIEVPHPEQLEPQRRHRRVRPRRQPLSRDRRRRQRLRSARERPGPDLAARQAAADRAHARAAATRIPERQPLRRPQRPRRDLLARAAQPVPLLLRPADEDDRDRRRRPGRARGDRLRDRLGARGANFGWDALRGRARRRSVRDGSCPTTTRPTPPDHERADPRVRPHGGGTPDARSPAGWSSATAGSTRLYGRLLFSDVCIGEIRSIVASSGGAAGDALRRDRRRRRRRRSRRARKRRVYVDLAERRRLVPARPAPRCGGGATAGARPRAPASATAGAAFAARTVGYVRRARLRDRPEGRQRPASSWSSRRARSGSIEGRPQGRRQAFLDIRKRVQDGGERGPALGRLLPSLREEPALLRLLHRRPAATSSSQEYRRSKRNPRDATRGSGPHRDQGPRTARTPNHNGGQLAVRARRQPLHRHRRRRLRRRPARERAGQGQPARQAPADRPAPQGQARLHGSRRATRSSGREGPTRSTRSACATRTASRSTAAAATIAIGDVGQDAREEIDYETLEERPRRQLRLGRVRGRAPLRLLRRQPAAATTTTSRSSTTATAAAAARSSAATSPRQPDPLAVRPLPLRRLLRWADPQPGARSASGRSGDRRTGCRISRGSRASARTPGADLLREPLTGEGLRDQARRRAGSSR